MTALENLAHQHKTLLSSDAMRYFISTTPEDKRPSQLHRVIEIGKGNYPLEDGWLVLNEARMKVVCSECEAATAGKMTDDPFIPTVVPTGAGSLAEALLLGDTAAAHELVGNRPMFALADAVADLNAVIRHKAGEEERLSKLLTEQADNFTEAELTDIVAALTSALDGTYSSEKEAVAAAISQAAAIVTQKS